MIAILLLYDNPCTYAAIHYVSAVLFFDSRSRIRPAYDQKSETDWLKQTGYYMEFLPTGDKRKMFRDHPFSMYIQKTIEITSFKQ